MKQLVLKLLSGDANENDLKILDDYFDSNPHKLFTYSAKTIITVLNAINDGLGYSIAALSFTEVFHDFNIDMIGYALSEKTAKTARKLFKLKTECEALSCYLSTDTIGLKLGKYYERTNPKLSLKYYANEFENEDFYYDTYKFYYDFDSFIELKKTYCGENEANLFLLDFIKKGINKNCDNIDFIYVISKYIHKVFDENLYDYAYNVLRKMVDDYRNRRGKKEFWSDTDEERALCEIISLKYIYYFDNANYVKTLETYNELTSEIAKSDCTRYYHVRDLYYVKMLNELQKDNENLIFFTKDRRGSYNFNKLTFKYEVDVSNIANKNITLINEDGIEYEFICHHQNNEYIYFKPILPIGLGETIGAKIAKEDGEVYLKPIF